MNKKEKNEALDPPELTAKDWKEFRRVTADEHKMFCEAAARKLGRPPLGDKKAHDIHLKIPPAVLARLRAKAHKLGIGYQTLINQVLARV